ncbi:hypothetical protein GGR57DRAFT_418370 [Xylariaceae sp. FL1272]|nr:hypothetical protein GGR57DRAFT_418370 [Xylariaceae sp. FL1272]
MADDLASQSQSTKMDALEAVHDMSNAMGKKLREGHLDAYLQHRDELLRAERPRCGSQHGSSYGQFNRIRGKQLDNLILQFDDFLKAIEDALPQALETLFSDLRREFKEPTTRSSFSAPLTPPTVSTELPKPTETILNKTPPTAPPAPMTRTNLGFRLRDMTPPDIGIINEVDTSVTDIGSPDANTAPGQRNKRPLSTGDGASTSHSKKKAKRTPQHKTAACPSGPSRSRQECNVASSLVSPSTSRDKSKQPVTPTSRDKGKQPERPLDHYWSRPSRPSALEMIKEAASSSTPSKQAKKAAEDEALLDSSYKPDSLFSASVATDADLISDDEPDIPALTPSLFVPQEDDNDFPRINSRGRTIPDYKEKPPSDEEFKQWQR